MKAAPTGVKLIPRAVTIVALHASVPPEETKLRLERLIQSNTIEFHVLRRNLSLYEIRRAERFITKLKKIIILSVV